MTYQLQIEINASGVRQIHESGNVVTIVKQVASDPPPSATLAWVTFAPFMHNLITWGDDYYLYAARRTAGGVIAASIFAISDEPVRPGVLYRFGGTIFTADGTLAAAGFAVENDGVEELAFGLIEHVTALDQSISAPVGFTALAASRRATFAPSRTLSIFLAPPATNGPGIDGIPSNALEVQFTSARRAVSATYDQARGVFVQDV